MVGGSYTGLQAEEMLGVDAQQMRFRTRKSPTRRSIVSSGCSRFASVCIEGHECGIGRL